MNKRRLGRQLVFSLALLLALTLPASAQPPGLPSGFYGTVQVNGQNVPDGTEVSAWISGVQYAETTTFTAVVNSQQRSVYTFEVPADDPDTPEVDGGVEDDTVVLHVMDEVADPTGTWHEGTDAELNLTATINLPPTTVSLTPSPMINMPGFVGIFQAVYSDPNGWGDLANVYLTPTGWNNTPPEIEPREVRYDVAADKLYIRDDTNTTWIGGFAPGTDIKMSNSKIGLDVSQTTVTKDGNEIHVGWAMFGEFGITSNVFDMYLQAVDSAQHTSGWNKYGRWRLNSNPSVAAISPGWSTPAPGEPITFVGTYSDEDGSIKLITAYIDIRYRFGSQASVFQAYYDRRVNKMYMWTGTGWSSGLTVGQPGILQNGSVILDVGQSRVSRSRKTMYVRWNITFKPGTDGHKAIWGYVYDNQGFQDGWALQAYTKVTTVASAEIPELVAEAPPVMSAPVVPDPPPEFEGPYRIESWDRDAMVGTWVDPDASIPDVLFRDARTRANQPDANLDEAGADEVSAAGSMAAVLLSPSMGDAPPGADTLFRTQFSDTSGYTHLSQIYFLLSETGATREAIYLRYDQNANTLWLRNSTDNMWFGGYAPGSDVKVSNKLGTLDLSQSSVSGAGNTLDVYWHLDFKASEQGRHFRAFMKATDDGGGTLNWTEKGWFDVNMAPMAGSVTPADASVAVGTRQKFITKSMDPDAWNDFHYIYLNVSSQPGEKVNSVYLRYDATTNQFQLANDAGTAWSAGVSPGAPQTLENSQVTLYAAGCVANRAGTSVTLTWDLAFKSPLGGTTKNIYVDAEDKYGWASDWTYLGEVDITS